MALEECPEEGDLLITDGVTDLLRSHAARENALGGWRWRVRVRGPLRRPGQAFDCVAGSLARTSHFA